MAKARKPLQLIVCLVPLVKSTPRVECSFPSIHNFRQWHVTSNSSRSLFSDSTLTPDVSHLLYSIESAPAYTDGHEHFTELLL